ncbi:MAG: redoxin domain-containing protein [Baekduia sp.]
MTIVEAGTAVPEFTLQGDEGPFTRDDLAGETTILVFYPFAFSGVCTDQLQIYDRAWDQLQAAGATKIYGVSTDAGYSQNAFKEQLGVSIPQLSDFEPKGEVARAFGAYFEPAGMTNRAIVIASPDQTVKFSHLAESPGHLPPLELLLDGLA